LTASVRRAPPTLTARWSQETKYSYMDLVISEAVATDRERAAIDSVLGAAPDGWRGGARTDEDHHVARAGQAFRDLRPRLLEVLHAVNDVAGWVSPGAVNEISLRTDIAPAEVFSVASFYALFRLDSPDMRQVHVCVDAACRAAGSFDSVLPEGTHPSPCLGACERAPVALLIEPGLPAVHSLIEHATPGRVADVAAGAAPVSEAAVDAAIPQRGSTDLVLLRRIGVVDPLSVDDYRANGGYVALQRALSIGAPAVIDEVTAAKLMGRGGAAFPTGRKWAAVASQPVFPHHLICNADESEPGTFKDRVVMEGDPFSLIEAMTIAAFATKSEHGWVYLRGEYPRAMQTLTAALAAARVAGLLGTNIMGSEFSFDIEITRGAGAYICGEETAIFNSIEGFRGEPRNKPPFPVEKGLFGQPTVVNNVETLINVLPILTEGGTAYGARGTEGSSGQKLFCLSGGVQRPGVYEVTYGVTLGELIEMAGGLLAGRSLQAVLLGGAAGSFVGPDALSMPLTMEGTRAAGATLGSGVVCVFDDTVDMTDQVRRIAAFFRNESCGQCVPCRVGTVRQQESLTRLTLGTRPDRSRNDELALLRDLGQVMRDASICGLGQTAHNAIDSALKLGFL
jgi:NADH-quinone oxidoreductase subunit F